ncbi:MAG: glycerophosphodiester phosphodiesterase [Mycobacteriales bacterium]
MLAIAHRAGNDLETLREAVRLGADAVEADVHLHDARLEVRHQKTLGPLPWLWDKWELFPAALPRPLLGDILDALPPGATVMLDLKGVGRVGAVAARVLHARSPEHPLMVCARWWPSVLPFQDAPWATVLLSARGHVELLRLRRRLRTGTPPDGVSVHLSMLTPAVVAEIKERAPLVLTWPVDDEESLQRAHEVGVSGVITKDLEIVRQVAAARR